MRNISCCVQKMATTNVVIKCWNLVKNSVKYMALIEDRFSIKADVLRCLAL